MDKLLALTGQTPTVQIANIVMPSEEENAGRRAIHERLDAIARSLYGGSSRRPKRLPFPCVAPPDQLLSVDGGLVFRVLVGRRDN